MKSSNVLPSLLHKRDQEVDTHSDVLSELLFAKSDVANSSSHAADLLGLELDSLSQFFHLGGNLFAFHQVDGETAHLDQDIA